MKKRKREAERERETEAGGGRERGFLFVWQPLTQVLVVMATSVLWGQQKRSNERGRFARSGRGTWKSQTTDGGPFPLSHRLKSPITCLRRLQ